MFEMWKRRRNSKKKILSQGYFLALADECHLCREDTYRIYKHTYKTSLSGETFTFQSSRDYGYLCPRCCCVGRYNDTSGQQVHVDHWTPTYPWPKDPL